ncbi:MAG TPA: hypothetical protein VGF95_11610 [Solirubrobacteraceae bacterium]
MESGDRYVVRDGATWLLGTKSDVAWIDEATTTDLTITSAIPPVFEAYTTIVVSEKDSVRERQDRAMVALLAERSAARPWLLGYLETSEHDDVVFPAAPRVRFYADWGYVLVQAGPTQAAQWRGPGFHHRRIPDLIFPDDRSWLVSMLWDDDWTCCGGSAELIDSLVDHPDLKSCARRVNLGEDATPPGHTAI